MRTWMCRTNRWVFVAKQTLVQSNHFIQNQSYNLSFQIIIQWACGFKLRWSMETVHALAQMIYFQPKKLPIAYWNFWRLNCFFKKDKIHLYSLSLLRQPDAGLFIVMVAEVHSSRLTWDVFGEVRNVHWAIHSLLKTSCLGGQASINLSMRTS